MILAKEFNMITRTILHLAIVSSISACGSSKKASNEKGTDKGAWQQQKVIADGKSNEWDKNAMEFDKNSKIAYKITNDEANLYLLIIIADNVCQTKILRAGMSLFIDPAAKKKETVAVNFPLGSGDAPGMGEGLRNRPDQQGQPGQTPDMKKMKAQALIQANQYSLSGFIKGSGGYGISQENDAGVTVKIDFSTSGEMVYEAVIPLASLTQEASVPKTGSKISVGFKINGLPKPEMSGGPGGGGGGMGAPGGGGMPPGGGMGGARGFGGGGGLGRRPGNEDFSAMQHLFKEVKIWKNIIIAQKA